MAKGVLKLKKYLILAVVTLLAVLLSACSGNVKSKDTSAENTTTQVSTLMKQFRHQVLNCRKFIIRPM